MEPTLDNIWRMCSSFDVLEVRWINCKPNRCANLTHLYKRCNSSTLVEDIPFSLMLRNNILVSG